MKPTQYFNPLTRSEKPTHPTDIWGKHSKKHAHCAFHQSIGIAAYLWYTLYKSVTRWFLIRLMEKVKTSYKFSKNNYTPYINLGSTMVCRFAQRAILFSSMKRKFQKRKIANFTLHILTGVALIYAESDWVDTQWLTFRIFFFFCIVLCWFVVPIYTEF